MTTASVSASVSVVSATPCGRGRPRGSSRCTDRGTPRRRRCSSSRRITSSAGLSRTSSMSRLYATPRTRIAAAVHRLALVVQRVRDLLDHEVRHLAVDLARQVDEARLVVQRAHLPREVVRIERNAVAADAGARRELHEAERLRRGRVDHFPHVDAQLVAHDRHLVDQADVHRAEGVLEQLDQLGRLRRRSPARWCRCSSSYSAVASSVQRGVMPPTTFGVFFVW